MPLVKARVVEGEESDQPVALFINEAIFRHPIRKIIPRKKCLIRCESCAILLFVTTKLLRNQRKLRLHLENWIRESQAFTGSES
jgi:hypothetical protein